MPRPLVIIHGWSDDYKSFKSLGKKLVKKNVTNDVKHISLGNYISLDDDVTFDDLVSALEKAWTDKALPRSKSSVDCIVHSTGALVIRDWIEKYHDPDNVPIKHLVMLAPANFGSHLAHKGRTFIARVFKGWSSEKRFETGKTILKGLELASPYSWDLAFRDRFGKKVYFNKNKILCTVLVGNKGYSGISSAANEDGGDGTVRVSTANMNCAYLDVDFVNDPHDPSWKMTQSKGNVAFGVMDSENHSTIAAKDKGPNSKTTLDYIVSALTVTDAKFDAFIKSLADDNKVVMKNGEGDNYTHGYQNTVFLVTDQYNNRIKDYFLEFYADDDDNNWFTEKFQRDVIRKVHNYCDDSSLRSVYVDCTTLHEQIDKVNENLRMSLSASPEYKKDNNVVGYRTFTDDDIGNISLTQAQVKKLFVKNRTLFVNIKIKREQSDKVFRFMDM